MTNEAIKVELYGESSAGDVRRYAIADGTAIAKGTLLYLSSDPRTAAAVSGVNQVFAGIAASAKVASDGETTIGAWTNGIFELVASGAIALGQKVKTAGGSDNRVKACIDPEVYSSYAIVVGTCLETAADGEVVMVRVGPL